MSNAVKIYDTTLRDGTQGEGISFSVTLMFFFVALWFATWIMRTGWRLKA